MGSHCTCIFRSFGISLFVVDKELMLYCIQRIRCRHRYPTKGKVSNTVSAHCQFELPWIMVRPYLFLSFGKKAKNFNHNILRSRKCNICPWKPDSLSQNCPSGFYRAVRSIAYPRNTSRFLVRPDVMCRSWNISYGDLAFFCRTIDHHYHSS